MSLHHNQEELLKLLVNNIDEPLTIRQLMNEMGLNSPGLVHHHITQLEKKGYLKRNPNNPNRYTVTFDPESPISFINLYGLAKCGPDGRLLSGRPIDKIPIASQLISFPVEDAFLVEADGDSMEPEIRAGDIVICKAQKFAESGDIIICAYEESVMIKRLRKLNERAVLESINSKYEPIIVSNQNELFIEGIFGGLIRR